MRIESGDLSPEKAPLGFLPAPGARFRFIQASYLQYGCILSNLHIVCQYLILSPEQAGFGPSGSIGEREMADEKPITMSVPEAGRKYFDLSRGASYAAADRGDIPTIRMGRLRRVPVRALERMLDVASDGA